MSAVGRPVRTVGVLGAGQLGRMLALAGYPLGLEFVFLTDREDDCARALAPSIVAPYTDERALSELAGRCDVVTYEFENVPAGSARFLAEHVPVYPPPEVLDVAQDRASEKALFRSLGIATPAFALADSLESLRSAVAEVGLPAVVKTRRGGYDGKGQRVLTAVGDLEPAWADLGSYPLIVEALVPFERELSVIAVRGRDGRIGVYPLAHNEHAGGILRRTTAPAPGIAPGVEASAHGAARRVLERFGYVGVLAIELFEVGGSLLANEIAPRVHNSGHWTMDGAACGQFENHVRAVAGLPLGGTEPRCGVVMENLIGEAPDVAAILAQPRARLHLYGKSPRPGRKLGHVNHLVEG